MNKGDWWIKLINDKGWQDLFDMICILDQGVFILKDNGLLKIDSEEYYRTINGKSTALGYLYLYLISHGTSLIAGRMKLEKYFDPINAWED